MRTLAVDYGTRRVGLAMSDAGGTLATPLAMLTASSPEHAAEQVAQVIEREGVQRIVIGLPLNMDDTAGKPVRAVVEWGKELGRRCGKPVVFVDERLSSFEAGHILRQGRKLTRGQKKQRLDAVAAATFLQGYLDGKIGAAEV